MHVADYGSVRTAGGSPLETVLLSMEVRIV